MNTPQTPTSIPLAALARHGVSFERFEKLSRKAAHDGLTEIGCTHLADDRFDSLALSLLEVGLRFAPSYDVGLANGQSFMTACYRRMRPRVHDWYRRTFGDSRYGRNGSEHVTATGELPSVDTVGYVDLDELIVEASSGLTTLALWALHHLARPMAEDGTPLVRLARQHGIPLRVANDRLNLLRVELGLPAREEDVSEGDSSPMRIGRAA